MERAGKAPGLLVKLAAGAFLVLALLVVVEVGSSLILIYRYRAEGAIRDGGPLSSVALIRAVAARLGLAPPAGGEEHALESLPRRTHRVDDTLGWTVAPGAYTHLYKRRPRGARKWETMAVKVTVNEDMSRWTGAAYDPGKPSIYIFGDSFVFGLGVNDEQTFAYHLQMAHPQYNVRLVAVGGWGLTQNYLRFLQLKDSIGPGDVVVIGYGDYYDARNVAAPSRLREMQPVFADGAREEEPAPELAKTPKAEIGADGALAIALVEQDCRRLGDYCARPDPPRERTTAVAARLINEMARGSPARVLLLHFDGEKSNPVFAAIDPKIKIVSALQPDFGYFIRDTVLSFDLHPGPYWHYAISRTLIAAIEGKSYQSYRNATTRAGAAEAPLSRSGNTATSNPCAGN